MVYENPPMDDLKDRTQDQLSHLHHSVKRFMNPHVYPAGLERGLHDLRTNLILEARGFRSDASASEEDEDAAGAHW